MTVLDLVAGWTEEERRRHTGLIVECLKREELLNDLRGRIRRSEEELDQTLGHLLSGLGDLAQAVNANADQIGNIYLCLMKAQGNP
jgi:hypothetical protein